MDTSRAPVEQPGQTFAVIGGYDYLGTESDLSHCTKTMGEVFTSIRQLMMRYNPVNFASSIAVTGGFEFCPYFIGNPSISVAAGTLTNEYFGRNALRDLLSGFVFARGSMRYLIYGSTSAKPYVYTYNNPGATVPYAVSSLSNNLAVTQNTCTPTQNPSSLPVNIFDASISGTSADIMEVAVPYYNKYYMHYIDAGNQGTLHDSAPPAFVGIASTTTLPSIAEAIGDDFQFGYFIGFLPVYSAYA